MSKNAWKNVFIILIVMYIIPALIVFLLSGCSKNESDEIDIMNTVCIDGKKYLSVVNGSKCFYHVMERNGVIVECNK